MTAVDWSSVFISYARQSSRDHAEALHAALTGRGVSVFLDTVGLAHGDSISAGVFFSLLSARVIVVFADAMYRTRRYCQEELATALAAYRTLPAGASPSERAEALLPLVVALGPDGTVEPELEGEWPAMDETGRLADLVLDRLRRVAEGTTFAARLERLGVLTTLRDRLVESLAVPPVARLESATPYHETGLPDSIHDAFMGRSRELWELHTALASHESGAAAVTTLLEGGGGFGKTRLALEYLHRYGPDTYPGGMFWLNAEVPDDRLESQMHGILCRLCPATPELPVIVEQGRDVARELGEALRTATGRVLYVVDNVPEPEAEREPHPLVRYCPAPEAVSLLVTTRVRHGALGRLRQVDVAELPVESAVRMLTRDVEGGDEITADAWREIARWAGQLPLALELLNALLCTPDVADGRMTPCRLLEAKRGSPGPAGALPAIGEVLGVSYRRLPDEARLALQVLAWLSAEPIPVRVLGDEALFTPRVRALLRSRSFVTDVRSGSVELYGRVHRVVAEYVRSVGPDPERSRRLARAALDRLLEPGVLDDGSSWLLLNACQPHVEAVLGWDRTGPDALALAVALARFLLRTGRFDASRDWAQRCAVAAAGLPVGERRDALGTLLRLAQTLQGLGLEQQALELLDGMVGSAGPAAGDADPVALEARATLAVMLVNQDEPARARPLVASLLDACHAISLGDEHATAVGSLVLLAAVLGEQEGPDLLERALATARRATTPEHVETLGFLLGAGQALHAEGRVADAGDLLDWVMTICEEVLGDGHALTLLVAACLAANLQERGLLEPSDDAIESMLEAGREALEGTDPLVVAAMEQLAGILEAQGPRDGFRGIRERAARVTEIRQELLEWSRRTLGETHPGTLLEMTRLAASLRVQGSLAAARELAERAVSTARDVLGDQHEDLLTMTVELAEVMENQQEWERAAELRRHALEARRRMLGDDHPATLVAAAAMADNLATRGQLEEARALLEDARAASGRVFGEEHRATIFVTNALAQVRLRLGDFAGAEEGFVSAAALARSGLGTDDPLAMMLTQGLSLVAGLALLQNRPERAEELRAVAEAAAPAGDDERPEFTAMRGAASTADLWRALDRSRREYGEEHQVTLMLAGRLGVLLLALNDHRGAVEVLDPALPVMRRVVGSDNEFIVSALVALGSALQAQGQDERARSTLEEAERTARRCAGDRHPLTLGVTEILAAALQFQGDTARALALREETARLAREVLGADNPMTLAMESGLGASLSADGQHDRAVDLLERVEAASRGLQGEASDLAVRARTALDQVRAARPLGTEVAEAAAEPLSEPAVARPEPTPADRPAPAGPTASAEVFISYAPGPGRAAAEALRDRLAADGASAFVAEERRDCGEGVPDELLGTLLEARVIVAMADPAYFTHRVCVEELATALVAYRGGVADAETREAVLPIVLALGPDGQRGVELAQLPFQLADTKWPVMSDAGATADLAALVAERLNQVPDTFGVRLERLGELSGLRDRLREAMLIPSARSLAGVAVFHENGLPASIGDAFVGRARTLWDLRAALAARPGGAGSTVVLQGAGGAGKTRLALEYVHRFAPEGHPGGVLWLSADASADRLDAQLHGMLRELRPGTPDLRTYRERDGNLTGDLSEALRERAASGSVLYVVDGLPEPEDGQLSADLARCCPEPAHVSLLVTTRARQREPAGLPRMAVAELEPDASVRLLTWQVLARETIPAPAWAEIGEWAGGLPLVLELLNAMLRMGAVSPSELLEECRGAGPVAMTTRAMEALRGTVPVGQLRGVSEALAASYWRLPEDARRALHVLAWLSGAAVPVALLAGDAQFTPRVREVLLERSFVGAARAGEVELFGRVHPVVADFVRGVSGDAAGEQARAASVVTRVMRVETVADLSQWPLLAACLPHAEAVLERGLGRGLLDPAALPAFMLGIVVVSFLVASYRLDASLVWGQRLVDALRPFGLRNPAAEGVELLVAFALLGKGRLREGRDRLERLAESHRGMFGDESEVTLHARAFLAHAMLLQAELRPARALLEELLAVAERTLGEGHQVRLMVAIDLGMALHGLGELAEGRRLLERTLEASRRLGQDGVVLMLVERLAMAAFRQGERELARDQLEWALAVSRATRGDDDPFTVTAGANLAYVLVELGDLAAAQAHLDRITDSGKRLFDDRHPGATMVESIRERLRYEQEDHWTHLTGPGPADPARDDSTREEAHRRVLDNHRRAFGEAHPNTLTAMSNLALAMSRRDPRGARDLIERAVAGGREAFDPGHPNMLRMTSVLADILEEQGELARAAAAREEVLAAMRRTLGEDDPETLRAMGKLAMTLHLLGETDRASELMDRALQASQRARGDRDRHTIELRLAMGTMAEERGDHGGAVRMYEQVRADAIAEFGRHNPFTLMVTASLVSALRRHGDTRRADELQGEIVTAAEAPGGAAQPEVEFMRFAYQFQGSSLEEVTAALEESRRLRGEEHAITLALTVTLGLRLVQSGEPGRTIALLAPALPVVRRVMGETHEMTLGVTMALGGALVMRGEGVDGLRMLEEAHSLSIDALGERHRMTLEIAGLLGQMLVLRGQPRGAELVETAWLRARESLGAEHMATLQLQICFGMVRKLGGDVVRSRELLAEALEVSRRVFGEDAPFTTQVRQVISVIQGGGPAG
jgi:tetratricopeptide (TPR) repeat protein